MHFNADKTEELVAVSLAAMKKLKGILPQSILFQMYEALVESHLRYADVVLVEFIEH